MIYEKLIALINNGSVKIEAGEIGYVLWWCDRAFHSVDLNASINTAYNYMMNK